MVRTWRSRLQRRLLGLGLRSVKGFLQVSRLSLGDTICGLVAQFDIESGWSIDRGQFAFPGQADSSRRSDGSSNVGVLPPYRPQLRDNFPVVADQFGMRSRRGMIKGLLVLSELSDP